MDFKAALVSNLKISEVSMKRHETDASVDENYPSNAPSSRRRRRRRHPKGDTTATPEQVDSQHPKSKRVQDSKTAQKIDGPPSLRLLQASPTPIQWEPEADEQKPQIIATRARERLAIRIQAHCEEQQNVARVATQMQAAYIAGMRSQLQALTNSLQEQHAAAIDARFAAHENTWKETVDVAVKELRSEAAQLRFRRSGAAHDSLRINALEAETRKLTEMLTTHTVNKSGEDGPSEAPTKEKAADPQLVNTVSQLQAQANAIQTRIASLHSTHDETTKILHQMQSAMVAAGLFSAHYPPNQMQKQSFPNYGPNLASFHPPAYEVDQRSSRAPSQAPLSDMPTYKENEPVAAAAPVASPVHLNVKAEAFPGTPQKHFRTFSHPMRMGMGRSQSSVHGLAVGSPFGDSTNRL